jgi:hypothetical protein
MRSSGDRWLPRADGRGDRPVNRADALALAFDLVEKMGNTADLNSRGYKVDGWRPMTGPEKADAVVKFAEFLMVPTPPSNLVAPETEHIHRASCHGPIGELQCGFAV